jgi:hypothetical protein
MTSIIISTYLIGMAAGWWVNVMMFRYTMKHSPNELINGIKDYHETFNTDFDDEDIDDPNTMFVSVEQVNTNWYLYDVSTNVFAGQGSTLDEAIDRVKERFPLKDVVVQQVGN